MKCDSLHWSCWLVLLSWIATRATGQTFPLLINAGEDNPTATFVDSNGDAWQPDQYFSGPSDISYVSKNVVKTEDDIIYQKQRFGDQMKYSIPVPPGEYRVSLYLTEMDSRYSNLRVFDILMEGNVVQDSLDMVALAGRRRSAIILEEDMTITDGSLDIEFVSEIGIPTIAGIKVIQYEEFGLSDDPSAAPSGQPSIEPSLAPSAMPSQDISEPSPTVDQFPLLINAGEEAATFVDSNGDVWLPDQFYMGPSAVSSVAKGVVKTEDDSIFQKQRFGDQLKYSIPIPPGEYKVSLYLTEMVSRYSSTRIFDIVMEGTVIQEDLDMVAMVGRRRSAIILEEDMTVVDGTLDIEFVAVVGIPTIAGIRLDQYVEYEITEMPSEAPSSSPTVLGYQYQREYECPPPGSVDVISGWTEDSTFKVKKSDASTLCTLWRVSPDERKPIARSYLEHDWEAYSGDFNRMMAQCDGTMCSFLLAGLQPTFSYELASFQNMVGVGDEVARFLEQATFGPQLDEINTFSGSFASWIEQQQTLPMSSHRRFFREHWNHRFEMPSYQGVTTHACDAGTRYRRYALSDKDKVRPVEIRTDVVTGRKILMRAGQARTVVNATTLHAGPPEDNQIFEDGM